MNLKKTTRLFSENLIACGVSLFLIYAILVYLRPDWRLSLNIPGVSDQESKKQPKGEHGAIAFQVPKYEASGDISVPGTDGILIVDDNNSSEVLWVRLDSSGKQIGAIQAVPLGTSIEDPEGITSDGDYYYIV